MASKREREEAEIEAIKEGEELKRQKSYNQIVSLLEKEEEEEEAIEDLSSIMSTLQQEISSVYSDDQNQNSGSVQELEDEGVERERVMRHLLEASDDELGIPNGDDFLVGEGVALCDDGLWELEDEAANYCTLFHSHLFM